MKGKNEEDVMVKPYVIPSRTWRHYLPGPILFLHLFAFILSLNTAGLYVPQYISKTLFPQRPLPSSTGSICTVNDTVASPDTETIQKEAAVFNVYVALASGIPAVVTSLFLGAFSDRFGRVFLFLTPTIGQLISKTILLFCIYYRIDINFILIGSAIEGLTGGFLAILMASFSYFADITENNKERSTAIAFLEIAVGVGVVVGRFSTGYIINVTDYVWPQVTACSIYTAITVIILFLLPETRAPSKTLEPLTRLSCLHYVKTIFSFYVSKTTDRWKYNVCVLIFFTTGVTTVGKSGVDLLYQISQPFCWDSVKVGWYGALAGLFQNVICMGMIKVLHLCFNDEGVSILGSISGIAGFILTAFATTDVMLYIGKYTICLHMGNAALFFIDVLLSVCLLYNHICSDISCTVYAAMSYIWKSVYPLFMHLLFYLSSRYCGRWCYSDPAYGPSHDVKNNVNRKTRSALSFSKFMLF